MKHVQKFKEQLQNQVKQVSNIPSNISNRVIELAEQIKTWHDPPIPERWYPLQLGKHSALTKWIAPDNETVNRDAKSPHKQLKRTAYMQ